VALVDSQDNIIDFHLFQGRRTKVIHVDFAERVPLWASFSGNPSMTCGSPKA
jgi:hypothetical protein